MTRLAEQQRTTIGTLKALGYSTASLSVHYLKFGVLVGVLGAVLGVVAGFAFTQGMIAVYRQYYEFPQLDNRAVPLVYVAALIIGVLFAMLGTVRGVKAIVRLDPAEAMRAKPPVEGGAIALERFRRLWRALGFRWQMIARNVWRNRWRSVVTMVAAMFGSALMLLAFYFNDALEYLVDHQFDRVLVSDMDLTFKDDRDFGALLEARRLPGVERAEPLFVVACEFRHDHHRKRTAIIGVMPDARLTVPRSKSGDPVPIPATGLAMSRRMAQTLDVRLGDTVTVVPIRGRRDPIEVPITRLTTAFIGMATYADYHFLNGLVGEANAVSQVQLETAPDLGSRLVLYRALKQIPAVQGVSDNEAARENLVRTLIESMRIAMMGLIGFAAAIYFGSILTTSFVALSERQREVATLRVVGYHRRQVGGIFLRESLLVNGAGALLGLPFGIALILLLIRQYDTEVYRMPLVLQPKAFVLTFGLGVGFTLLAHGPVQRAINRLDWLEALNAKE